ncbi:MAG: ATP-binding protein [Lachnospiraceae bacterium]|nr:ATP-binding protein [Lachnospiraceae bacterium]
MKFPVKYIENNLVLNTDGEWYAYFEINPYSYSFLSDEKKEQTAEMIKSIIAAAGEGSMQLLMVAGESSISNVQESGKTYITGPLADAAMQRIDEQTDALTEMVGSNQTDYRFYAGFRLISDAPADIKNIIRQAVEGLVNWYYSANEKLAGDFTSVSSLEVRRYEALAYNIEKKLSRLCSIRSCSTSDTGYIIEHIYGCTGTAYEDYHYEPKLKQLKQNTLVKKYDIIRLTGCAITEHGRYLEIDRDHDKQYVSYLTINEITDELDFPGNEILYYGQEHFDFPVSVSMNIEAVPNMESKSIIRKKKAELDDLDNNAYSSGHRGSGSLQAALDDADELADYLDKSKDCVYKLSYIVRVSAASLDELNSRCDIITDYYSTIKLVRPYGDQLGLHGEFIPSSKRYINDYIQYVKSDSVASLGFGASHQLGEPDGIYIGYNIDTDRNVYIKPWLAAQGVKGSITNALSAAFLGSLGGGKSFSNNLLVYYSVLFGARAVILDPKSERGGWKDRLTDISDNINIVNITNEDMNRGMLDPYVIMPDVKDAEALALDILTYLTGITIRDSDRFTRLRNAVKTVSGMDARGLLKVIDVLRIDAEPAAKAIADHIEAFADYDIAHLLFSDGSAVRTIDLAGELNIIQVADLILPDKGTSPENYTAVEMISVAVLMTLSSFCLEFIKSDREIFKIVDIDEAWSYLQVAQGRALANKLVRAGRAMNAGIYFCTQNAADLGGEDIRNNIGLKFAFRSTDIEEIKNTLEFFGLDPDDEGCQKRLKSLENGQCLMQDIYGHTGVLQFHPVFADLFDAFDTRPPVKQGG